MKLSAVLKSVDGRTCEVEIEHTSNRADADYWQLVRPAKRNNLRFPRYHGEAIEMAIVRAIAWVLENSATKWWRNKPKSSVDIMSREYVEALSEDDNAPDKKPPDIELDEQQLRFAESKSLEDLRRVRDRQQYPEGRERIQKLVDWKKQQLEEGK